MGRLNINIKVDIVQYINISIYQYINISIYQFINSIKKVSLNITIE